VPYVNLYNQITFLPVKEITKMISHNLIKRKNVGLGAVKNIYCSCGLCVCLLHSYLIANILKTLKQLNQMGFIFK